MIPKKLHQIWLSDPDTMPLKCQIWCDEWKDLHPSWEYKLWNGAALTDELINKYNLQGVHPAIISDILRILIVRQFGGVYLDVDVRPVDVTLDELLDTKFLCFSDSWGQSGMLVHGAAFGSIPNHPMLDYILKRFEENSSRFDDPEKKYGYPIFCEMVLSQTGPGVTIINPTLTRKYLHHTFMKSWQR